MKACAISEQSGGLITNTVLRFSMRLQEAEDSSINLVLTLARVDRGLGPGSLRLAVKRQLVIQGHSRKHLLGMAIFFALQPTPSDGL